MSALFFAGSEFAPTGAQEPNSPSWVLYNLLVAGTFEESELRRALQPRPIGAGSGSSDQPPEKPARVQPRPSHPARRRRRCRSHCGYLQPGHSRSRCHARNRGTISFLMICPDRMSVKSPSNPYPTSIRTLRSLIATSKSTPLSVPFRPSFQVVATRCVNSSRDSLSREGMVRTAT